VNLIDQKGRELLLGNMFQDLVRQLNSPYVKYGAHLVITVHITREMPVTLFWPSSLSLLLRGVRFDNYRSLIARVIIRCCSGPSCLQAFA
jgi:hypothetical protein